jgi:NADH-quinone oxidoreductase subunit J
MVTISRNTVNSVFFLILVFVSVSILFILIGAEFLGMIMLSVYVGAVAVLFLFIVMMLNISEQITKKIKREGFINNIPAGLIVGIIIFLELIVVVGGWKNKNDFVNLSNSTLNLEVTNTHALGNVLYTDYIHLFQISGIILLIAMIGAIYLTFNKKENVKRQSYFDQIQRDKTSGISLIDIKSGEGIKIDD